MIVNILLLPVAVVVLLVPVAGVAGQGQAATVLMLRVRVLAGAQVLKPLCP